MERNHIQLQSSGQSSRHYRSGDPVVFECKPNYRRIVQREKFRAQCLDGVIEYPKCACKCSLPQTRGRPCRRQLQEEIACPLL